MKPFPTYRHCKEVELRSIENDLPTFYGLPPKVEYCAVCVLSNQRHASAAELRHDLNTKKEAATLSVTYLFLKDKSSAYERIKNPEQAEDREVRDRGSALEQHKILKNLDSRRANELFNMIPE